MQGGMSSWDGYMNEKPSPASTDQLDYVAERSMDALEDTFDPIRDDGPSTEGPAGKERNFDNDFQCRSLIDGFQTNNDMPVSVCSAGNEKAEGVSKSFDILEKDVQRLNPIQGCAKTGLLRINEKEKSFDNMLVHECGARKKNAEEISEIFLMRENEARPLTDGCTDSDWQTNNRIDLSFQNLPSSECHVKEKGFVEDLGECTESGFKLHNGKERLELLQEFTGMGKYVKEGKKREDWYNSDGDERNSKECNDTDAIMEIEDSDKITKTAYVRTYGASSLPICRPNHETDSVLLIEGIQSACSLSASPSSIYPPPSVNAFLNSFPANTSTSLPTNSWARHLDLSSREKSTKVNTDVLIESRCEDADHFLRETSSEDIRPVDDGLFTGAEALPSMDNSFHQPCRVECAPVGTYEDYTNLLTASAAKAYTSHNQGVGGIEGSGQEPKITIADSSLRHVLSDSITGVLMEDAMVAQCGHSYGVSSLERVLETNLCLSCGTHVPTGSLVPNYALRAAVQAYKREEQLWMSPFKGLKRRREQADQPESSDGKKVNRAYTGTADNTITCMYRSKGVQFPFVVNDRVLIKGNKRTPERFVGREAIITTQCLNGWYLVRTLDNGESVRLQYRSLQKLGEMGTPMLVNDIYAGHSCDMEASKGHSSASAPTSLSEDVKEGCSPSNLNGYICLPTPHLKGLRSECLSKSVHKLRAGVSRPADMIGSSWLSGGTSSNSSQELISSQSEEKILPQDAVKEQPACGEGTHEKIANTQEGLQSTETLNIPVERSENGMESSFFENSVHQLRQSVRGGGVLDFGSDGRTNTVGNVFTVRSKRSVLHSRSSHLTTNLDLPDIDPYKKVYVYSSRRRGSTIHVPSAELESKPVLVGAASLKDHQQEDDTIPDLKHDISKVSDSLFENVQRGMLLLESDIPWTCLRKLWKQTRPAWLKSLQDSRTIKDLGSKVREFHDALLLTSPGGMPEEEWEKQLNIALESGKMDLIYSLWERLQEDVLKWMEAKPNRNTSLSIKDESGELAEVHKIFPHLNVEGLSLAGITAATTVAAAEAFADGKLDMEVLLSLPMKLLQKNNHKELVTVREAIEREKRHIAAKLLQIEAAFSKKNDLSRKPVTFKTVVENPEVQSMAPVLLALEAPTLAQLRAPVSSIIGDKDNLKKESVMILETGKDGTVKRQDEDGEATDLSDSE